MSGRPQRATALKAAQEKEDYRQAVAQAKAEAAAAKALADRAKLLRRSSRTIPKTVAVVVKKAIVKKKKKKLSRQALKRKTKPLYLTLSEDDDDNDNDNNDNRVWLATATLPNIKEALRRKHHPYSARDRHYFVTVPSVTVREDVYELASYALEDLETRLLPTYGGRSWKVIVKVQDPVIVDKNTTAVSPYFVWNDNGELELASWTHLRDRIPVPPKFPGFNSKKGDDTVDAANTSDSSADDNDGLENSATQGSVKSSNKKQKLSVEEIEAQRITELQEREASPFAALVLQDRWRVPLPVVQVKWISPLRQTFYTRKSAWEHAIELCKNEVLLDRVMTGHTPNGNPLKLSLALGKKSILKAGKLRFERDGLWVVGQEEKWQYDRIRNAAVAKVNTTTRALPLNNNSVHKAAVDIENNDSKEEIALDLFIQSRRKEYEDSTLVQELTITSNDANTTGTEIVPPETEEPSDQDECRLDTINKNECTKYYHLDSESCDMWTNMPDSERFAWMERSEQVLADRAEHKEQTKRKAENVLEECEPESNESVNTNELLTVVAHVGESVARVVTPCRDEVGSIDSLDCTTESTPEPDKAPTSELTAKNLTTRKPAKSYMQRLLEQSKEWRLNDEQISLCFDAGIAHYDQVTETIKVRDLYRELRDGFDVLRERGKGRFDMEIPAFDKPDFDFLTSTKKAPWMPIVREILGKDVVLIHKGMFLSLPGSETQDYHQDGVHLTTQYQRPCHAINVFVPLVDLQEKNGPTEFCIGSHILGEEDYEKDNLEVPLAKAGTPVIFDYRLGHKGLANTDTECRPIVYCTYAASADGKEFRDSANFSSKRYHKIGDLVGKTLSRKERAIKRGIA